MKLSEHDRMRLAVATKLSLGVVHRWVNGGNVTSANDQLLLRSASELGIAIENEESETEKAAP